MEKNICCDKCGRNIRIKFRHKRVEELEYTYFYCKRCGAVYIISVTDEVLRKEIKKYQKLAEELQTNDRTPEKIQKARLILQSNVRRSQELKEKYPLKLK